MKQASSRKLSATSIIITICTIAIVVSVVAIWNNKKSTGTSKSPQTSHTNVANQSNIGLADVIWQDSGSGWTSSAKAPACPNPILKVSPVDMQQASSILLPGQYRGTDYKAHGGFRFDHNKSPDAYVRLPLDARLMSASRYIEDGETQYLLDFQNPCGIQIRFDHLLTLAPALQKIIDQTLPKAKVDDSRTTPISDRPTFKSGTLIATQIGHKSTGNYGVDFGVYDLRQPNEMSKSTSWAMLHSDKSSQTFYGVCWLDLLPSGGSKRAHAILPLETDDRGASDYCSFAPGGSTLQYNGGRPVTTHSTASQAR